MGFTNQHIEASHLIRLEAYFRRQLILKLGLWNPICLRQTTMGKTWLNSCGIEAGTYPSGSGWSWEARLLCMRGSRDCTLYTPKDGCVVAGLLQLKLTIVSYQRILPLKDNKLNRGLPKVCAFLDHWWSNGSSIAEPGINGKPLLYSSLRTSTVWWSKKAQAFDRRSYRPGGVLVISVIWKKLPKREDLRLSFWSKNQITKFSSKGNQWWYLKSKAGSKLNHWTSSCEDARDVDRSDHVAGNLRGPKVTPGLHWSEWLWMEKRKLKLQILADPRYEIR